MAGFYTTTDVAEMFGCTPKHVRTLAERCRVGFNVGGRSGWKFNDCDVETMRDSMRPAPVPAKQRPPGRSRSAATS